MDNFLDAQAQDGELESTGQFSISWSKAESKLADFYRANGSLWVVKFYQALVALGSRGITTDLKLRKLIFEAKLPETVDLEELFGLTSQAREHFRIAVKAIFSSQSSPLSVELNCPAPSGFLKLQIKADGTSSEEVRGQRLTKSVPASIVIEWPGQGLLKEYFSWFGRRATILGILKERFTFSPTPISFQVAKFGLGCGKRYGALAAEYIVAPLRQDTLVRELQPGFGSRSYDFLGRDFRDLGSHPRYFTRWLSHPCEFFPESENPVLEETVHERRLKGSATTVLKSVPHPCVGIFGLKGLGRAVCAGYLKISPDYLSHKHNGVRLKPALPCYASISIPQRRRSKSKIFLYQNGALLGGAEANLGVAGAEVHLTCPLLKTDFSGMQIVRDDTFKELENLLRERTLDLAAELVRRYPELKSRLVFSP